MSATWLAGAQKLWLFFFFFFLFSQLHFLAWQVEQLGFQPVLVDAGGIPGSGLTCHVTALALID